MKEVLVDTDVLSLFLRGDKKVKTKVSKYLTSSPTLNISILSYYEILSGLKHKDARQQTERFLEFCKNLTIIPLTKESSEKSADIYARLRKRGEIIDDVDILIAGICLENNFAIATNNVKHFSRIEEIEITNWSE